MEGSGKKEKDAGERERWKRIKSSRYNRWYEEMKNKGLSEYLKRG